MIPSQSAICASFRSLCPFFSPQQPVSSNAPLPPPVVDVAKVTGWLRRHDEAFSRLQRIDANGAYSLLQKEIQDITPILAEGKVIVSSPGTGLSGGIIDTLAKPRLVQLQQVFTNAQKKLADNPEVREKDEKLVQKWNRLGLPQSILENHIDCARFLIDSSLAFRIVGYRETCQDPALHDVQLAADGMPMIKVEGVFKRWDVIKRELVYDEKTDQIHSSAYPGQIVQNWTYLSPQGLVPIDRLNHDRLVPIYQLNPQERQRALTHAQKFYETNTEVDLGIPKDWVVQFHTSPRRQFVASIPPLPDNPLLDNVVKNLNTHIVIRLIAPNGDVYSFGVEMPVDSQEFLWENNMAKMLGTVNAKINKAGDYEEFRTHVGRLVTGIPLTGQRAQNIINFVNRSGDIRFNFLRQNCANLTNIVMKFAGYEEVPLLTTVKEFSWDILPDVKHIPCIGPLLHGINQVFSRVFSCIASITPALLCNAVSTTTDVLFYIPRKIHTFAINLFLKYLGGAMMLHPLIGEDEEFYNAGRFLNFSKIIRSWRDLLSEQTMEVYHSKYFIEWQKQQHSTFLEPGAVLPRLAVVPPAV